MSSQDCDSETTRVAKPANGPAAIGSRIRETIGASPQPALSGYRLVSPGLPEIYLVDPAGYRRRIPNHTTYNRLFRSWRGIVDTADMADISEGAPLTNGTLLVRGDSKNEIYLLDEGRKRVLTRDQVMDKYWFNWGRVCVIRQVLMDQVPEGDVWE
jgi:hypothetical protein